MPTWLSEYTSGRLLDPRELLRARLVYYPGSHYDGHPVELFGSTHAAHCFVLVDFKISEDEIRRQLNHPRLRFRGYQPMAIRTIEQVDLITGEWQPPEGSSPRNRIRRPRGLLTVLARDSNHGDEHGPSRIAVLVLMADGIAAFHNLFCQDDGIPPPFAVLLHDHGFGGNYDWFGGGGLMARTARNTGTRPPWLLVAANTRPWAGYERVENVDGHCGGVHKTERFLHRWVGEAAT
jgi:hypothetical protein